MGEAERGHQKRLIAPVSDSLPAASVGLAMGVAIPPRKYRQLQMGPG